MSAGSDWQRARDFLQRAAATSTSPEMMSYAGG